MNFFFFIINTLPVEKKKKDQNSQTCKGIAVKTTLGPKDLTAAPTAYSTAEL